MANLAKIYKCSECGSSKFVKDSKTKELVCFSCGLVVALAKPQKIKVLLI